MSTTPTLGLSTYDTASGSATTFLTYRLATSGLSSNMTIIDTYAQGTSASIAVLKNNSIATINASQITTNYYEASSTVVTGYNTNMPINLKLNATNTGAVTLNINSYGVKNLKKVNTGGSIVDFISNDLLANRYYTFIYDGTQFVLGGYDSTSSANGTYSGSSPISVSGSVISLNTSGVTSGSYNQIIVDQWGRVTSASFVQITTASSCTVWIPDAKPTATSGSYSDEFDDDNLSGWSEFDPGNIMTASEYPYGLRLRQDAHAGDQITGMYKETAETTFNLFTRVNVSGSTFGNFFIAGIALYEMPASSASRILTLALTKAADNSKKIEMILWNTYLSINSVLGDYFWVSPTDEAYIRAIIDNTKDIIEVDFSLNGISWNKVLSVTKSGYFNPVGYGPYINIVDGDGGQNSAIFSFFRYTSGSINFDEPLYGNRVKMYNR